MASGICIRLGLGMKSVLMLGLVFVSKCRYGLVSKFGKSPDPCPVESKLKGLARVRVKVRLELGEELGLG